MPSNFKPFPVKPMTGMLDTLSTNDAIGFGNWRVVKNAPARSARSRQRGGGWRRLFADESPYNNHDLHDQLTDRLWYYDAFSQEILGGGGLAGYNYPYFAPSYTAAGDVVFPSVATGPHCGAYIGDFPSGLYNGCTIFYPTVGLPYAYVPGFVDPSGMLAHWRMDTLSGGLTPDEVASHHFESFGCALTTAKIGLQAINIPASGSHWLQNADADFQMGDIRFGFTGWLKPNSVAGTQHVLGRWQSAGGRSYRLIITGGVLRFDVSNDGTATVSATSTHTLIAGDWVFFACWHDPVANTINIKVNALPTITTSHTTGALASGTAIYFTVGLDEEFSASSLDAAIDSLTAWKNGFPSEVGLSSLYNSGEGMDYPFDQTDICNTGYPHYYLYSALYSACATVYDDFLVDGYGYGPTSPFYHPRFGYTYNYCGVTPSRRSGCREAVTLLDQIVTSTGRKLIAGTMSRVYELNQSTGNWRILADGLGNSGYTVEQCGCNARRAISDTMGGYLLYTNGFDYPMIYFAGDAAVTCDLNAMQPITDMIALGISSAGGVVCWKGFAIFYDITEAGERKGGEVIWSDIDEPYSIIESDTSFAGRATVAVGETILNAAELGNALLLYTEKSIIRATLVGGEDVFHFETIYVGGNAMKYKYSLIAAGDSHLYAGGSDVFRITKFDTRPIAVPWISKAAGMIYNGIVEDDATYLAINEEACDLVTGGYHEDTQEAWLSWPTGDETCPSVTLRMNLKYNCADIVDHGFTAFLTFHRDDRPTVGQWIEDMGICQRGTQVVSSPKEGGICENGAEVENPPLYIRNPEEDPDLPVHEDSLCARLDGQSMSDFCEDCKAPTIFITASAEDFCLKQQEDAYCYREMVGGGLSDYDAYACGGEYYIHEGYDTVMQQGAEFYRSYDEKMIKRIIVEAEPAVQAIPSDIEADIGYGPSPSCMRFVAATPLPFDCQTAKSTAQHQADGTRNADPIEFPVWRRGVYLAARIRIGGIGGAGKLTGLATVVSGWGQAESP
jgi:hypothetical protein